MDSQEKKRIAVHSSKTICNEMQRMERGENTRLQSVNYKKKTDLFVNIK